MDNLREHNQYWQQIKTWYNLKFQNWLLFYVMRLFKERIAYGKYG